MMPTGRELVVADDDQAVDVEALHQLRGLLEAHRAIGGQGRRVHQMTYVQARPAMPQVLHRAGAHDVGLR